MLAATVAAAGRVALFACAGLALCACTARSLNWRGLRPAGAGAGAAPPRELPVAETTGRLGSPSRPRFEAMLPHHSEPWCLHPGVSAPLQITAGCTASDSDVRWLAQTILLPATDGQGPRLSPRADVGDACQAPALSAHRPPLPARALAAGSWHCSDAVPQAVGSGEQGAGVRSPSRCGGVVAELPGRPRVITVPVLLLPVRDYYSTVLRYCTILLHSRIAFARRQYSRTCTAAQPVLHSMRQALYGYKV
eukprot:COSAG01_NODE_3267_length_6330_cov_133.385331_5_plen_250_part_00